MQRLEYRPVEGELKNFSIETDENNQMIALRHSKDPYAMNWIHGTQKWGTVKTDLDLSVIVTRKVTERKGRVSGGDVELIG